MTHFIVVVAAGLIGLFVGGVVNILADDLPDEDSSAIRAPHYPDGTPRPPGAWPGLLAFLARARTSPGGARLSWRHPITEVVLAIGFAYIAAAYPFSIRSLVWMIDLAILALITIIDLEHRLILYVVMLPAYVLAIIGAAAAGPELSNKVAFADYLIGGAAGFGLFFVMYLGGRLFRSIMSSARGEELEEEAFGFGDVMLATLCGLMLGWQAAILAVLITVLAGAAGALVYIAVRLIAKGRYEMLTPLPYGQYIVLGTVVMLLWGEQVRAFLQR
jgi:leader peptidase (prepilin peptidase)/N-methyltransferase